MKIISASIFFLSFSAATFAAHHGEDADKKEMQSKVQKEAGPLSSSGTSAEASRAAQTLVNRLSLISSLEGKFKQSIIDESGSSLQDTQGTFRLKRPGFLDWNTAPPFEQRVISNGKTLWVYDPDLEQVTIYDQQKMQNGPANILNGSLEEIKANYIVVQDSVGHLKKSDKKNQKENKKMGKKSLRRFTLTPKDEAKSNFSEVVLVFTDSAVQKVSMLDKLGQQTIIRFSEAKPNTPMAESEFSFTPPADTDVVIDGAS